MAAQNRAPGPGPSLPTGSRVFVVVSRGPAPGPTHPAAVVPDVRSRAQGEALQHLQQAGLNAQVFNDHSDLVRRDHVIDQFPAAGASADAESEAVILVSSGPAEKTAPTPLPDVVGLHETDAVARLSAAGLYPQVVRDFHPNVEEGVVLAQLPGQAVAAAGKHGRSLAWLWILVAVLLLAGAAAAAFFLLLGRQVSVPDVTGQQQVHAEQVLTANGLKIGTVSVRTDASHDVGSVLEQSPQGGVEVDSGSAVDLVISGSSPEVAVPSVVGQTGSDAKTAVTSAGFVAQVAQAYSNTVPVGVVISQLPQAGARAVKGSTVNIVVSLGTNVTNVTLPDFVGMTQAVAVDKAVSLGLRARVSQEYSATAPAGQVVDQIPDAGVSVPPATTIGLSVSLGTAPPTSVTVPDLNGQSTTAAESAITTLGLVPTAVSWDGTGKPVDTVVGQSPKAGEQVAAGGSVVIFVSSGK